MDNVLCSECADRETCTELCKEVEDYISQDEVRWRESPVTIYTFGEELRVFDVDTEEDKFFLTPKEKEVLRMVVEGEKRSDIAKSLMISIRTVDTHMLNIRKKVRSL